MLVGEQRVNYGLGGSPPPYLMDLGTDEFRRSTKKDVADCTRLGDFLTNMSFVACIAGAFDVPYQVELIHELEALLNNTSKHIVVGAIGSIGAKYALNMAATVVGGMDALKKRPIISMPCPSTSPLTMSNHSAEALIEFAKAGIPIHLVSYTMYGASAPMTIAGAQAIGNAEFLFSNVVCQTINPGTPVIRGVISSVLDMRTSQVCYAAPESTLSHVISGQLARHYGIPCYGSGGCTDSKCIDAQAGSEAMFTAIDAALAGINIVMNSGTIAHGHAGSMEMAVICDEICNYVRRYFEDVEINEETLATDLICKIGPGGQFLAEKHTMQFFDKGAIYLPGLFNRDNPHEWKRRGRRDIQNVAKEKVRCILRDHNPSPIPKEIQHALSKLVKDAETELCPG